MRALGRYPLQRAALTLAATLFVLLLLGRLRISVPSVDPDFHPTEPIALAGELRKDTVLTQEFVAKGVTIERISLHLATYARRNRGSLTVQLDRRRRGRWERLAEQRRANASIVDNQFCSFSFVPPLRVRIGDHVLIRATSDANRANAVAWWMTPGRQLSGYRLLSNDSELNGVARFAVTYGSTQGKLGGAKMRTRVWHRVTVFLGLPEQFVLALSVCCALIGALHLLLWLPREEG